MTRFGHFVFACGLMAATSARAAEIHVQVNDGGGDPVSDAVVSVMPESAGKTPARPAETKIIDQKNETFVPYVAALHPGDKVIFRNSDKIMHHVYSFSPIKSFEFVINSGESSPEVQIASPGVVTVGCNIHDHMITYLYVSEAPIRCPWLRSTDSKV